MMIHPDFLCEHDEERLVIEAGKELAKVRQKKGDGRNRIWRAGWDYENPKKWLGDIPKWLKCDHALLSGFDSIAVNEYTQGQTISPHIDSMKFGEVVILSLLADAMMQFVSPAGAIKHFILQRRSLAIMSGELRKTWRHETLPLVADRRISVVYRTRL